MAMTAEMSLVLEVPKKYQWDANDDNFITGIPVAKNKKVLEFHCCNWNIIAVWKSKYCMKEKRQYWRVTEVLVRSTDSCD